MIQFSSVSKSCWTLCPMNPMNRSMPGLCCPSLSITNTQRPHKPKSIQSVSHPTISTSVIPFSSCPQSFPASGSFQESALLIRWLRYWSFSFNISPSNKHPGLISFRMDWLDFLSVQGTLENLLQLHSSKASILQRSAFFTVQLPHPYMTTGKTIALTRQTFVDKVISLLFNTLSKFVTGEGNGTPLQYFCLENPMDGGAWKAAVHGIAEGRTRLSTFHFRALEKEMATHSSIIAWRIPGSGEPGGLLSMGLHKVGHD